MALNNNSIGLRSVVFAGFLFISVARAGELNPPQVAEVTNPEAAAVTLEQDQQMIRERDANSDGPDYWPMIDPNNPEWVKAHPGWQDDPVFQARTNDSIHSVYKYGYQTVLPGQTEESVVTQVQAPAPPCPAARSTGCTAPAATCCPAGQIYTGNGCNTGNQLCCAKGTQGCTQLDCRTSTVVGGGVTCANDNTTCRSSTDGTVTAGTCQLVHGTDGTGSCPCQ